MEFAWKFGSISENENDSCRKCVAEKSPCDFKSPHFVTDFCNKPLKFQKKNPKISSGIFLNSDSRRPTPSLCLKLTSFRDEKQMQPRKSKIRRYIPILLRYAWSKFKRQFQHCRLYISGTAHVKLIHCSIFCFRILCLHIEPNTFGGRYSIHNKKVAYHCNKAKFYHFIWDEGHKKAHFVRVCHLAKSSFTHSIILTRNI